jgi:hypothetical protein
MIDHGFDEEVMKLKQESRIDEPRPRWKFGEEIGQRAKLPAKKNSK